MHHDGRKPVEGKLLTYSFRSHYFSLEVGTDGSIASGVVWSDQEWLGDRAQFRPEAFPGWSTFIGQVRSCVC